MGECQSCNGIRLLLQRTDEGAVGQVPQFNVLVGSQDDGCTLALGRNFEIRQIDVRRKI